MGSSSIQKEKRPAETQSTSISLKVKQKKKVQQFVPVDKLLDSRIDLIHEPTNSVEEFALGQVFKLVNVGANKMLTNQAILDNYDASVSCLKEYHALIKASNDSCSLPQPPTVKLNKHNINDVYDALYKVSDCHIDYYAEPSLDSRLRAYLHGDH